MGITYRKSLRLGKFIRLNFSKRGPSVSVGPRGMKLNIGADGKERITTAHGGFRFVKTVQMGGSAPSDAHHQSPPKSLTVIGAYFCWVCLGIHYLYFNRPGLQALYWLTLGGVGVWAVVDLFRIPGMVRVINGSRAGNAEGGAA
jgi:hypothetical protein